MEYRQNDDEIDLGELLLKTKNALLKSMKLIIGFTLLGLLAGILSYYLRAKVYENEMLLHSDLIEESMISAIGENLNKLVEEQNYKNLSEKLKIPLELSSDIRNIEIEFDEEQKTLKGSFFLVRINSVRSDEWEVINAGILSYFSNTEYVNKRIQLKKENYQSLITKLNQEIGQIDSLKGDLNGMEYTGKNNIMVLSPSTVYQTLIDLYKEQLNSQENLQLTDAIEVIDSIGYEKPVSAGLAKSAVIGFIIGLVLSFIVVFFLEIADYLKRYENA